MGSRAMEFIADIKVKKLSEKIGRDIPFLRYATDGAAGLDLPACLDSPLVIEPGSRVVIPTGLAIQIPSRYIVGLVFPRSGLAARHGISLANAVGVIDSDYKGEVLIALINQGDKEYLINPGERVAQIVFMPVFKVKLEETDTLEDTARGTGGFGSTGQL
jgi:dUTP pyrophosphatase